MMNNSVESEAVPGATVNHIAFIPDGNRRWAKEHGLPAEEGHKTGLLEVCPAILKAAFRKKIHTLTLWLFSTENWNRSKGEVQYLMKINQVFLQKIVGMAHENRVKMVHLGRKDRIPDFLLSEIRMVEKQTQDYGEHQFNFAIDYGGRDELIRVIQKIQAASSASSPSSESSSVPLDINEKVIDQLLDTAGQKHACPDIILRTSGEHRVSGFLPWQSRYSELFFLDKCFPDFNEQDLEHVLDLFQKRERRFGV